MYTSGTCLSWWRILLSWRRKVDGPSWDSMEGRHSPKLIMWFNQGMNGSDMNMSHGMGKTFSQIGHVIWLRINGPNMLVCKHGEHGEGSLPDWYVMWSRDEWPYTCDMSPLTKRQCWCFSMVNIGLTSFVTSHAMWPRKNEPEHGLSHEIWLSMGGRDHGTINVRQDHDKPSLKMILRGQGKVVMHWRSTKCSKLDMKSSTSRSAKTSQEDGRGRI